MSYNEFLPLYYVFLVGVGFDAHTLPLSVYLMDMLAVLHRVLDP